MERDEHVAEGDKPVAGEMHAFEICEDIPEGEVCREVELEVCHTSNEVEDELCPEVEVRINSTFLLGMWVGIKLHVFPPR